MAEGPGIYDDLCTHVREEAQAQGAVVIVLDGNKGSGFSAQGNAYALAQLPGVLKIILRQMERDADFGPPQ